MPRYIWDTENDSNEKYAVYDEFGGAQIFYLQNIQNDVEDYNVFDSTDMLLALLIQLFIHEDVHEGITESGGVDTTGDQDHNVMDWIKSALYNASY